MDEQRTEEQRTEAKRRGPSDADVHAIADALEARMVSRFYLNRGQGVWAVAWKVIVVAMIVIACMALLRGIE